MGSTPRLDAAHFFLPAEVIAPELGLSPTTLTGDLAGLSASQGRAVMLVMPVTVIRTEKLSATTALAPARFATHRAPSPDKRAGKSNPKSGCEEDPRRRRKKSFQVNSRRRFRHKKTEFQTGGFPPLSFRR
jgi:hypothetical protein